MKPTTNKRKTVNLTKVQKKGTKKMKRATRVKEIPPMENIWVLVNKDFEFKGFKPGFEFAMVTAGCSVIKKNAVVSRKQGARPEVIYKMGNLTVTVFCIENIVGKGAPSSNSKFKFDRLTNHFKLLQARPDCIFSVSTSESTYEGQGNKPTVDEDETASANGCVYVGGRFFIADCRTIDKPKDKKSELSLEEKSAVPTRYFPLQDRVADLLANLNNSTLVTEISKSLQTVPSYSAKTLRYLSDPKLCCVGVVNVTNYAQYPIADGYAYGRFYTETAERYGNPICIETTHGVVRMVAEKVYKGNVPPVIFVSPITDRFVRFDKDVTSTKDKEKFDNQNYACSYNSGIAVAHMMKFLDDPKSYE